MAFDGNPPGDRFRNDSGGRTVGVAPGGRWPVWRVAGSPCAEYIAAGISKPVFACCDRVAGFRGYHRPSVSVGAGMDGHGKATRAKQADELSFHWLYGRVQDYAEKSHRSSPSKLERRALWIGIGMGGLGLAISAVSGWIPQRLALCMMVLCLVAEVAGLALSMILMMRRELPQFARAREAHASDLDGEFAAWQLLVAELRRFPTNQREAHLRFVTTLRQNMGERMGLLFGGIQRLGVFPVLVALYLQFRDWHWGDWAGAFDVNLVGGLLIFAMLLLYAGGWYLVGLRARLDAYVSLLDESLKA